MRKSQAMFEFIIILTIMIIILSSVIVLDRHRSFQVNQINLFNSANSICKSLAVMIDYVSASGKGSGANFTLPENIESQEYSARISSGNIIIFSCNQQNIFCPLKTLVSNGTSNSFELKKGVITILNEGEEVLIS